MKYISFFSGAMGLDLGLEKAGFECLAMNEFNSMCIETIKKNKPNTRLYDCDIRSLSAEKLQSDLNLKNLELIVGGPPCQSFSSAGRRKGLGDERGFISLYFVELISKLKPQFFILENVRGLLSATIDEISPELKKYEDVIELHKKGSVLQLFLHILKKAGYNINYNLYDTSYFGVPQKRERIIIIGSLTHKVMDIPATHSPNNNDGLLKPISFKEACQYIKTCNHINFDEWRCKYLAMLTEGQNWKNLPLNIQEDAMGNAFHSGGGKVGFYRRIHSDKPTPTLVTSPRMPATMLCHPYELRPLSVEEYARIQTFPDDFVFCGKIVDKYRQIGNAVPVEFGYKIGLHLLNIKNNPKYDPKIIQTTKYKT